METIASRSVINTVDGPVRSLEMRENTRLSVGGMNEVADLFVCLGHPRLRNIALLGWGSPLRLLALLGVPSLCVWNQ